MRPTNLPALFVSLDLASIRKEVGMTQAQLADAMCLGGHTWTRVTVAEIEGSRGRGVSLGEGAGLAAVFGISLDDLVSRYGPGAALAKTRLTRLLGERDRHIAAVQDLDQQIGEARRAISRGVAS